MAEAHVRRQRGKADRSRAELNRLAINAPDVPTEAHHLYRCPGCGQIVDRRQLGDVLLHEEPGHERTSEGLRFVQPMMPTLVVEPPEGDEWQHEIKYDGYRTQLVIDGGRVRAFTRNGHDWTAKYSGIVRSASQLFCASAIIDGEAVIQDERGRSDFHAIKGALAATPEAFVFMAFDLLHLNGRDLRARPLLERRALLAELLGANERSSCIHFSDHVIGSGAALLAAADEAGLEGIVSKRITSRYRSGPSKSWLKTKCFDEAEFVVIGTSRGDRAPVALLARETDSGLEYAGPAWVTLSDPEREAFWRANERLKTTSPALPMEARKETSWLRPEMKVRAKFLRGEETLRHATVKALVSRHVEEPARVRFSEPTYSNPKLSRDALLAYYREIAPLMLPWVGGRPLNLFRCLGHRCFFQRNRSHPNTEESFEPPIMRLPIQQKNGKTEDYLYVTDAAGLLACVEAAAVEFHGWGSRVDDIEKPDRIVFDLDPDEGVSFERVKEGALQLRRSLEAIGLESFPLLTGGKGLHLVVPLDPAEEWPQVRGFAKQFCTILAEADPDSFTVKLPKAERRGRIFLDYLRNQRTSTAVLPYSVRARPGAPVAVPIAWGELVAIGSAAEFKIGDVEVLIARSRRRSLKEWGQAHQGLPPL